jgi:hypothetical protein
MKKLLFLLLALLLVALNIIGQTTKSQSFCVSEQDLMAKSNNIHSFRNFFVENDTIRFLGIGSSSKYQSGFYFKNEEKWCRVASSFKEIGDYYPSRVKIHKINEEKEFFRGRGDNDEKVLIDLVYMDPSGEQLVEIFSPRYKQVISVRVLKNIFVDERPIYKDKEYKLNIRLSDTVDLIKLVKKCQFDEVSFDTSYTVDPQKGSYCSFCIFHGMDSVEVFKLFCLDNIRTYAEIVEKMDNSGYRPACFFELLIFFMAHPEKRSFAGAVVALGSYWDSHDWVDGQKIKVKRWPRYITDGYNCMLGAVPHHEFHDKFPNLYFLAIRK